MKGEFAKNELKLCALFYTWFTKWIRQIKYCNKICSERILMLLFSQKFCKQFASEVSGECSETKLVNKCHSHHILAECEVRGEKRNDSCNKDESWQIVASVACESVCCSPRHLHNSCCSPYVTLLCWWLKNTHYPHKEFKWPKLTLNMLTYSCSKTWQIISDTSWFKFDSLPPTCLWFQKTSTTL